VRGSRESTLSGDPLSEEDVNSEKGDEFLTEKEKLAKKRELERREVVKAKLTDERSKVRNDKI
jgi:hypothetical protein